MFPAGLALVRTGLRPLRTRGDVPSSAPLLLLRSLTAPHTRRCSPSDSNGEAPSSDRSAHAEMIRDQPARAEQVSPRFQHRSISSDQPRTCGAGGPCPHRPATTRDQPRACGAGERWPRIKPAEPGSTPRVRGRFDFDGLSRVDLGINPARAGQVRARCPSTTNGRDQPRACGTGSCIVLRSCPGQRHAIFDSFIAESVASAHRYQCDQGRPANAAILQPT